jgi:hypothetical protein
MKFEKTVQHQTHMFVFFSIDSLYFGDFMGKKRGRNYDEVRDLDALQEVTIY